jgi:hypothetical protein
VQFNTGMAAEVQTTTKVHCLKSVTPVMSPCLVYEAAACESIYQDMQLSALLRNLNLTQPHSIYH